MAPIARSTAAVIVVFRPDADPRTLVDSLSGVVALTVLADNSATGHPALPRIPQRSDLVRLHPRNQGGLAGAYNQALRQIRTAHPAHRPGGVPR